MAFQAGASGQLLVLAPPQQAPLHQTQGCNASQMGEGSPPRHVLQWADCIFKQDADRIWFMSRDGSLFTDLQVAGAEPPAAGEIVGGDWAIPGAPGSPFQIRYTVKNTDADNHAVAVGIGNAILGNSAVMAALATYSYPANGGWVPDGFGYTPYQAGVAKQSSESRGYGNTRFDVPYGTVFTPVSSAHITVSIARQYVDGGPNLVMERAIAGHTPGPNDLGPFISFQGASGRPNTLINLLSLNTIYTSPRDVRLDINTLKAGAPSYTVHVGAGMWMHGAGLDPGAGNFSAKSITLGGSASVGPTRFAPMLTFGGGNTGITYGANNAGVYTKTNKTVTWQFELQLMSKGSSSGIAKIALPVEVYPGPNAVGTCTAYDGFLVSVYGIQLDAPGGASTSDLEYHTGTGVGISKMSDASFDNSSMTVCSITYVSQ